MPRRILYYYASAAVLLGCANDEAVLVGHLEGCGLVSEGEIGPGSLAGLYAPDDCYRRCLAAADCDDLHAAVCRTDLTLRLECDGQCAPRCVEDDAPYAVEQRCDGVQQCADGSDEADCPGNEMLRCDDGVVRWGRRCDGVYTCPDGYDEARCALPYTCDGAREYGAWERCNGYAICADGADERDCPSYRCESGQRLIFHEETVVRCDGIGHCGDGSDERGCATLQVTCF